VCVSSAWSPSASSRAAAAVIITHERINNTKRIIKRRERMSVCSDTGK
jgi:hypothetical protein